MPYRPFQTAAKSGPHLNGIALGWAERVGSMREVQQAAMRAIGAVLDAWGLHPDWVETRVGPFPAMGYGIDDVDVHARFLIDGSWGEVWIHPHELSVRLHGQSRVVEWQDFPGDPEAQIRRFCERMQQLRDA